jgi:hypothetical protein
MPCSGFGHALASAHIGTRVYPPSHRSGVTNLLDDPIVLGAVGDDLDVGQTCSSLGATKKRAPSLRIASYSLADIETFSVHVSLAHSQIHFPTGKTRLKPLFSSLTRSLIWRKSVWLVAARSSRALLAEQDLEPPASRFSEAGV